jgi:hypothetical protein
MIDYSTCSIERVTVHRIGNKVNEEELKLSESTLSINGPNSAELMKDYFLSSFNNPEMYFFDSSQGTHEMNPMWENVSRILEEPEAFMEISKQIATRLYDVCEHPNIKSGELFIALLRNITFEGQDCDAIGIFKSETKEDFLNLVENEEAFVLSSQSGMPINKLDKGCLIFDLDPENGYLLNVIDRSSRGGEAHFWRDSFLKLRAKSDDYHHTRNFLSMTKSFVTEQVGQEFDLTKTDKIDMLNRSIEYFQVNDKFDSEEFGQSVFGDEEVMTSFQDYGQEYQDENDLEIEVDFAISAPAVKKQSRIFKSVLKLDKNFHVYIHGNKDLIERGVDDDGRKFYKIYYKEER